MADMAPSNDQPNTQDNPAPAPAEGPAPAPVEDNEPTFVDPDDQRIAEIKAEVDKPAPEGDQPAAAEEPGAEKPEPKPDDKGGKQSIMVPKERLDQSLRREEEAIRAASYWRGQADANKGGQQAPKPDDKKEPEPEVSVTDQQLAAIAAEEDALAQKFEDGDISVTDHTKQMRALRNREAQIREQALTEKVKSTLPAPGDRPADPDRLLDVLEDRKVLKDKTSELEAEHPYLALIPAFDPMTGQATGHYDKLARVATERLATEDGYVLPRGKTLTPKQSLILRTKMAEVSDELGPEMTGIAVTDPRVAKKSPAAAPGAQTPSQPQKPGELTPEQKARKAKLDLRTEMPPDINKLGQGGAERGEITEAEIMAMSEEEILERVPEATRRRLIGL